MAFARRFVRLPEGIRAKAPWLKRWTQRARSRHLMVVDIIGLSVAVIVALAAWTDRLPDEAVLGAHLWAAGIIVSTHVAVAILLGLYATSWHYASIDDMGRILVCTFAGTASAALIVATIVSLDPPVNVHAPAAGFWLLEGALALGALATPRFLIRAASDLSEHVGDGTGRERTLLYGAGWAGVMVTRSAERNPQAGVEPVGFLDDNRDLKGRRVAGLQVFGGLEALGRARRSTGATVLLITMPRAAGGNVRRVVEAARQHGLEVRTVPAMTDLIDGTIDATLTRRVRVEDLLRRPPASEHSSELRQLVQGHVVMVTGAAGSIGSELVRQLIALEPGRIVMVDQAESAMYMVARALETRSQVAAVTTAITTHLVDVTDREAVTALMRRVRPVVVFHAAAYKHVPMLEEHPAKAVRVNMGGTRCVVDAAVDCGVERFVLVSTDKAVRPTSVMGASKRIAEMIVADAAQRTGRAYVSVRFGNVLGSNGSVVPVFQAQLESGQPLTVTDPDMTRYFMTIPEASWLILDAAALSADRGGLFVLDMGEPVRILDLASDLIRLSGRDPETTPIEFVGARPGEKIHEELFYEDEDVVASEVPKVLRCTTPDVAPTSIRTDVERWLTLARDGRDQVLRTELLEYVQVTPGATGRADAGEAEPPETRLEPVVAIPVGDGGNGAARPGAQAGDDGHDDLLSRRMVIKPPAAIPVEDPAGSRVAEAAEHAHSDARPE